MSRVFLLINSLHGGGAERQAIMLAHAMAVEKIFLLERVVAFDTAGVAVHALSRPAGGRWGRFVRNFFAPFYAMRVSRLTSDGDIIISFMGKSNLVNILVRMLGRRHAILCERIQPSLEYEGPRGIVQRNLMRLLYPVADIIVANSLGVKEDMKLNFGIREEKIEVIYNECRIGKIQEDARAEVESKYIAMFDSPVIVNVGRLSRQKEQMTLIRIFGEVKKSIKNARLVILGDGGLREPLTVLSRQIGLKTYAVWEGGEADRGHDVYFLGFQGNPYKYISRSTIFVLTSLWEGFPNVLLEAMACGIPVVSSDCRSGPRELLAPDTDFRVQAKAPEFAEYGILMPVPEESRGETILKSQDNIWSEVLVKVLNGEDMRRKYSQKGLQRAIDFDVSKIVRVWTTIVDGVKVA